jgi:hypothetical protein
MNKVTVLNKNDYELLIIPFKEILQKRLHEKGSIISALRYEVERQYPFFDIQSQIFIRLAVLQGRLVFAVVIMEAGVMTKYRDNKLFIQYNKSKIRVFYSRKKFIMKTLASFSIVFLLLSALPYLHNREKETVFLEHEYSDSSYLKDLIDNEYMSFSELFIILQSIRNDYNYNIESLSILYESEKNIAEISLLLNGIFPENILKYFPLVQHHAAAADQVLYSNNSPSFNLSILTTIHQCEETKEKTLIGVREVIFSCNGLLKYERNNSREIMAVVKEKDIGKVFEKLTMNPDISCIKKLNIVLKNNFYELTFEMGLQNISPFSSPEFCSFTSGIIKNTKVQNEIKEVPEKKTVINKGTVVGKIIREDGSLKVFYKSADGKLISEVQ